MHDTDTMPGMALRDHELASARLGMLGELSWVCFDELRDVYGAGAPSTQVAQRVLETAEGLRQAMQAHFADEHPDARPGLYPQFIRPERPVRPGHKCASRTG